MKKREFASKLQFQKITIASFDSIVNLRGGALQNPDTLILSVGDYTCKLTVCDTNDQTNIDNTCPPRPTTRTGITDYCDDETRIKCELSLLGCIGL